jgi:hypothetical protein
MDAIIPLMLLHYKNFGNSCAGLVFVTNAGLDPGLSDFLQTIRDANNESDLLGDTKNAFEHMARGYMAADPALTATPAELFAWLRGIRAFTDQGHLEDQNAALSELADVVVDYSEIDLSQRQAKQIAREIVSRVRGKVAHSTTVVPAPDQQLRQDKGIVISELLNVLSLSSQAYEQLKAGEGSRYREDSLTPSTILPKEWNERLHYPDLWVQSTVGYLAYDRTPLFNERRLYAFGE